MSPTFSFFVESQVSLPDFHVFCIYPILKEVSLVLHDSFHSPEIMAAIENITKSITQIKKVHNIRMGKLGSYLIGDMHVVLDNGVN